MENANDSAQGGTRAGGQQALRSLLPSALDRALAWGETEMAACCTPDERCHACTARPGPN